MPSISSWPGPKPPAAAARKAAILAGACEAVIAALYLDGGMDAARAFIERYWSRNVRRRSAPTCATPRRRCRNGRKAAGGDAGAPVYRWSSREAPTMRRVSWSKWRSTAWRRRRGEGGSKREAEQDAAAKLLARAAAP